MKVRELLKSLPQKEKWLFTNCSEKHAIYALELLNLKVQPEANFICFAHGLICLHTLNRFSLTMHQDCFTGVIGADMMGDTCKPEPAAFQIALNHIGAKPENSAMFEDSVKNLRTAKAMGMTTLLITGPTALEEGASTPSALSHCDGIVSTLSEPAVRKALPVLW
jgi:putative hydrolase of the HAD superfamily